MKLILSMCFIYIYFLQLYTVVNLNISVIFFVIVLQKCLDLSCFSKAYLCILVTSLGSIFYLHFYWYKPCIMIIYNTYLHV
jgi:hypothetical protein